MTQRPRFLRSRFAASLPTALLLPSVPAFAHFGAQDKISQGLTDTRGIFAADLNADGRLDVLAATSIDGRISWYENLGGDFGPRQTINADADGARAVVASDLDGDGDPDVLFASALRDTIGWHENLGGGAFGPERIISTSASGAESVDAADLDGDGDPDVLSASGASGRVSWYENQGGAFGPERVLTSALVDARRVTTGDLDGDGVLDVLAIGRDSVVWFENLGSDFGPPAFGPLQLVSTEIDGGRDVRAADIDGDGALDVVSASEDDDKLAWYENLGGGVFGPQQIIIDYGMTKQGIALGDVDGDGDADLVAASSGSFDYARIAWYENLGGSFAPYSTISTRAQGASTVFVADLDADGRLDVLSGSSRKLAWYPNIGPGNFGVPTPISSWAGEKLLVVDIDGDGLPDTLRSAGVYGGIQWQRNLGGGAFGPDQLFPPTSLTVDVTAGDLDGDGDVDVVTTDGLWGILLFENLGGGVFADFELIHEEILLLGGLEVGDMDGDGDTDLLATIGSSLGWYENDGSLPLGPRTSIGTGYVVHVADLDGDLDLDVVTGSNEEVLWYENLGGGAFGAGNVLSGLSGRPTTGDLNGDGALDILVARDTGATLGWFENLGSLVFDERQAIPNTIDSVWSAQAADLDGDGDADILATGRDDGRVCWLENLGGGAFSSERAVYAGFSSATGVAAADLDGDGRPEIVGSGIGEPGLVSLAPGPAYSIYCTPGVPNSTGAGGRMFAYGSSIVAEDNLRLVARDLPREPNIGYFLAGQGMNVVTPPGAAGPLCVGPGVVRFLPSPENTTELDGGFLRDIGTSGPVSGRISPGSTWSFQAWHRDSAAGTSNFTDAISVIFD